MKKRLFSLVAAAGFIGLVATAQAGGLTPMSNSSLASVSAQGVNINQTSVVDLSGNAQENAAGFVIANMAGTAANDQINVNAQCSIETSMFAPHQENNGLAVNDVQLALFPTKNYKVSGHEAASYDYSGMAKTKCCKCSPTEITKTYKANWDNTYVEYRSNKTSVSRVDLAGNAQRGASGLVIANMSSSAANNQVNLNAQGTIKGEVKKAKNTYTPYYDSCGSYSGTYLSNSVTTYSAPAFVPYQVNNGIAINNVGAY